MGLHWPTSWSDAASMAFNPFNKDVGPGAVLKDLGITHGDPPDLSKGPDAAAIRNFSGQLVNEYNTQQNANAARPDQQAAIDDLKGVANGTTNTAADTLLTKGTDAASRAAMGTAATYSAQNPGDALRQGLAAQTDIGNKAASDAAIQKAQEQAAARGQLVAAANALRQGDIQNTNNQRVAAAQELNAPLAAAQASQALQQQANAANQTAVGGLVSTAGGLISDERLKSDIHDGSRDADAFLESLKPRDYAWKNPSDPRTTGPGEKLGVIAQEMRPRDTGETADGTKFIKPEVVSQMLAGLGRIHERLAAVEGKRDDVKWGPNPYPRPEPKAPPTTGERRG